METKGEQIQNRYKYPSMMRIINMQKIGMASKDFRQKDQCFSRDVQCLFFSQVVEACVGE